MSALFLRPCSLLVGVGCLGRPARREGGREGRQERGRVKRRERRERMSKRRKKERKMFQDR